MQLAAASSLAYMHDVIRALLLEGYKGMIVAPHLISGWRDGRVKRVATLEDDAELKYRLDWNLDPCEP